MTKTTYLRTSGQYVTWVTSCSQCPMFRVVQSLHCAHPAHMTEADAHIIDQDETDTIAEKCPLRQQPLTQVLRIDRLR